MDSKRSVASTNLVQVIAGLKSPWPWLLLVLSLLATGLAWNIVRDGAQRDVEMSFNVSVERAVAELRKRLQDHQQILYGAAALFAASQQVNRRQWREYVGHLRIEESLPDMQRLGFAPLVPREDMAQHVQRVRAEGFPNYAIWPASERPFYVPLLFVEPATPQNERALGFDVNSDPVRRAALERCRDKGAIAASGKITPATESPDVIQPGFILCLPVYRGGATPKLLEERRSALIGFVLVAVRMNDLMGNSLGLAPHEIGVEIYDGATPSPESLLFDADGVRHYFDTAFVRSSLSKTVRIETAGQPWTLFFEAGPAFYAAHYDLRPSLLLAAGLIGSALLFGIAWALSMTRLRAVALAKDMTAALSSSEARFAGIIHSAMDGVITVDDEQRIVMFNPAAEKMFHCPAADAIGMPVSQLMPERFRATHHDHLTRFGVTGVTERAMGGDSAIYGLRANGEEFPIEASISQLSENGKKLYTVILRDITERKRAEKELKESRDRLRELSGSLQQAREEEKTRIARELHDDLGQRLTALKMDLATLQAEMPTNLVMLKQTTDDMNDLIDDTVGAVRRIAADLRPVMLDDLGLVAAVEWLVSDFSRRHGVKANLTIADEDVRFDEASATAIYRMIQEALTNVSRHADASEVTVKLIHEKEQHVIIIHDNGKGILQEDERKFNSFGLLGMRERAHLLGGKVLITGEPGGGTTVQIVIPRPNERSSTQR